MIKPQMMNPVLAQIIAVQDLMNHPNQGPPPSMIDLVSLLFNCVYFHYFLTCLSFSNQKKSPLKIVRIEFPTRERNLFTSLEKVCFTPLIDFLKVLIVIFCLIGIKESSQRSSRRDPQSLLKYFFKDAVYFVMKSNNQENIVLSKDKGVWSTPPQNEHKLNRAFKEFRNVILIFSVKESGRFQGRNMIHYKET